MRKKEGGTWTGGIWRGEPEREREERWARVNLGQEGTWISRPKQAH